MIGWEGYPPFPPALYDTLNINGELTVNPYCFSRLLKLSLTFIILGNIRIASLNEHITKYNLPLPAAH